MRDLGSQLRAYYDRISRPTDPKDIVAGKLRQTMTGEVPNLRPWWRRPAISLTAAALATLLLVGGAALMMAGSGDVALGDTTTVPSPSTAATTTTEAVVGPPTSLEMTWERIDDPVFDNAWISAVAEGGPGLVAVGYVLEEPDLDGWHSDAAVWVSADGFVWNRVNDPAAFSNTVGNDEFLIDVATNSDGLTALGFINGAGYTRFTSADGLEWVLAEDGVDPVNWLFPALDFGAIQGAAVYDVVEASPGYVAVGRTGSGGAIWVSSDGVNWERVAVELSTPIRQFQSIAADSTTILAFGWDIDATGFTTLRSSNGFDWIVVDAPDGAPPPASSAAFGDGRLVVVGIEWSSTVGIYVSDDGGMTLHRIDASTPALTMGTSPDLSDIVVFRDGFVAVGGDKGRAQQGQLVNGDPMIGLQGRGAVWIGTWNG